MRSLTIIFLLAVFALASSGLGEEWKRHPSVEQEFNTSKCVFVGEVIKATIILEPGDFIHGTYYTIRIEELLKGSPPREVEIYSENSSGRFPLRVGMRYLVFSFEGIFEGIERPRLAINNCGNSWTGKAAVKALTTARRLKSAKAKLDGATNRIDSIRSESNRKSSAAVSRR